MLIEICANSLQSALNAEKGGADRIELCSELGIGGITPSYGLLKLVKEKLSIPVHVLIRPRSGDFTYSDIEFDIMKRNVSLCKELGFDGVVSGVLNLDFSLDIERTQVLKELAGSMKFTFHRAFDWVKEPFTALEQLENMGFDYILTSGQQKTAIEGVNVLSKLKQKAKSCVILPGSGINAENVLHFKNAGFAAVHLSATTKIKKLEQKPLVPMVSPNMITDDTILVSSIGVVKAVCDLVI